MHYYLYQITNKVNGKIYVGVHKTRRLDDGYMGSGKVVRSAVMKHGIENFTKVILETFDTSEAMYAREAEIVTDAFLARDDVYNLRRGGFGGFDHINKDVELVVSRNKKIARTRDHTNIVRAANASRTADVYKRISATLNEGYTSGRLSGSFAGQSHTVETKLKIGAANSLSQRGSRNSQSGTMWITNGVDSKKINRDDVIPEGWHRGRFMK